MLAISLRFLAGRYHATPWGRHVNEADIAWPPDPWRITRALIATWYRKLDHDRFPRERLVALLSALAVESPVYKLPAAVHAHTRHYMPVIEGVKEKRTLIFDAFACVRPDDPLIVCWRNSELDKSSTELLDELLIVMGYLGRAESWVEAQRLVGWVGEPNCYPGDETVDKSTGEFRDVIPLLVPKTLSEYLEFRNQSLVDAQAQAVVTTSRRRARASSPLEFTLPEDWLTAIARDTGDLQKAGWSAPPAANKLFYVRPCDALSPQAPVLKIARKRDIPDRSRDTTARFALYGKPLPRIEDAVRVGEWCRLGVMATAKNLFGENGIPPALSGHDLPENNIHGHAFWLPEDADGDGRIDHVLVHVADGMDEHFRRALGRLRFIKNRDGEPYTVMLEGIGLAQSLTSVQTEAARLAGRSTVWETVTPYLHPWHVKKKFSIEDQLRRECLRRGLPEITQLVPLASVRINGRERTPINFHRFRAKRGLTQPDTHGSFWRIHFATPVQGPLALGFACHFGLGMFAVIESNMP